MIDFENDKITILKNNEEKECDIIFTFDSEDTGKSYIGFTDNSIAKNGRKNIYVKSYNPLNDTELQDITDPAELEMIGDVLKQIEKDSRGKI